jgi:hypothetical protein
MQPTEPLKNTAARAKRARRIATIRRRAAASLLATFVLAFGAVWQTGSMGASSATAASSSATGTGVASGPPVATTSSTAESSDQEPAATPVTTSQS